MGSIKVLFIVAVLVLGATGLAVAATGNQATPADDGSSGSPDGTVSDDISAVTAATPPVDSSAAASAVYGDDKVSENEDAASADDESADDEPADQESFDDVSTSDAPAVHDSASGPDSASVDSGHAGADAGSFAESGDDKS